MSISRHHNGVTIYYRDHDHRDHDIFVLFIRNFMNSKA